MANYRHSGGSLSAKHKLQGEAFHSDAVRLLSGDERNNLLAAIRRYQHDQSIRRLAAALLTCLNTVEKLSLLRHVRRLLPANRLRSFDEEIVRYAAESKSQVNNKTGKRAAASDDNRPPSYNNHADNNKVKRTENTTTPRRSDGSRSFRIVSMQRRQSREENLGFNVAGGKELNTGVFVSKIVRHSAAENAGLRVEDELVEVNGISLEHIALPSAVKLFSSLTKLKLVVRGTTRSVNSNTTDLNKSNLIAPRVQVSEADDLIANASTPESEDGTTDSDNHSRLSRTFSGTGNGGLAPPINSSYIQLRRNSSILNGGGDGDDERRINLIVESTPNGFIGFCIRGGSEHGLGIYVSRVDPDSTAEECGLQAGDQILDANGVGFETISHQDAVDYIKSHEHIILTVKAVGKIPESKCYVAEYSWLAPDGTRLKDRTIDSDRLSKSLPVEALRKLSGEVDFPDDAEEEAPWNRTTISLPSTSVAIKTGNGLEESDDHYSDDGVENELGDFMFEAASSSSNNNSSNNNSSNYNNPFEGNLTSSPRHEDVEVELSLLSPRNQLDGTDSDVTYSNLSLKLDSNFSDSLQVRPMLQSRPSLTSISSEMVDTLWHVDDKSTPQRLSKHKSFLQRQSDKIMSKLNLKRKLRSENGSSPIPESFFDKTGNVQLWIKYVDGEARKLLDPDEYKQLMDQLYDYLEKGDVELLTMNCTEVLDTPDKWVLLKAIRTVVFPYDVSRFDARVSRHELEHMSEAEAQGLDPELLDGPLSNKPPKRTLITAIQGKSGKFQLRSTEDAEILEKAKEEKAKIAARKYFHAKTILDRDKSLQRYNSFKDMPRPSPNFGRNLVEVSHNDLDHTPVKEYLEDTSTTSHLYATVDKSRTKPDRHVTIASHDTDTENGFAHGKPSPMLLRIPTMSAPTISVSSEGSYVEVDPDSTMDDHAMSTRDDDDAGATFDQQGDSGEHGMVVRLTAEREDEAYASIDEVKRRTLLISKDNAALGISISGGVASVAQPEIRIEHVYPGGAASEVEGIKAGLHLLTIDDHSLVDAAHQDAVDWIRQSFQNKDNPYMVLEVDDK